MINTEEKSEATNKAYSLFHILFTCVIRLRILWVLCLSAFYAKMCDMREEELKILYTKMYEYMVAKDISALNKIYSDDFVLVHMTGMKQNKQEYLRAIENGTLNYFSQNLDEIIIENNFKFIGRSRVSASVFGGGIHTWRLELTIELNPENLIKSIVASTY